MPINTVIREKRKELGYTQEQVAAYLNVSAPAVNKWEKGTSYPDIALLPSLARLLKVDLNTLLCFQEGLSQQEIYHFSDEAAKRMQSEGIEAGFELMERRIREYPHCAELIHTFALLLDGTLMMSELTAERKKCYEDTLLSWYRRVADSEDEKLKTKAAYMLASKYMLRKDFEKAQEMIDLLPEYNMLEHFYPAYYKDVIQANLYLMRDRKDDLPEAEKLLQRKLLTLSLDLYGILNRLVNAALAAGDGQKAEQLAGITGRLVKALDLWEFYTNLPLLDIALNRKDIPEIISHMEFMLDAVLHPWEMKNSPLYDRIAVPPDSALASRMLSPLLSQLEHEPEYEFLRADEDFRKMLEKYRSKL